MTWDFGLKYQAICQEWEESERGWGVRPDGFTLHLSLADRDAWIKAYWARMPDSPPDEYSRPSGQAYWCEVDKTTYQELEQSTNQGIWGKGNSPKKLEKSI